MYESPIYFDNYQRKETLTYLTETLGKTSINSRDFKNLEMDFYT